MTLSGLSENPVLEAERAMDQAKILIIEPRPRAPRKWAALLSGLGTVVDIAGSPPGGPEGSVGSEGVAVVVLILAQPGGSAVGQVRSAGTAWPSASLVVLTDRRAAADGLLGLVRTGVIDQVAAADNEPAVFGAVRAALERRRLAAANAADRTALRKARRELAGHVRRARELEEIYDATLENLMTALDLRDVETYGHSRTVAKFSRLLAARAGLRNRAALDSIAQGALLHDVGKIAIPDDILKKPGPLSPAEWQTIRRHPALGFGLIKEIKLVPEVGHIILRHHERFDGTGYPGGLKGEEIPPEARIFAVADALDAMTSHRPYRKRRDTAAAAREIAAQAGTQFDPEVVAAFSTVPPDSWDRIRFETTRFLPVVEAES